MTGGAKSDKIYAYYGNPDAPAAADVPGTYDAQQVLVLSFGEPSGIPQDSTAYKNNPSASTAELTPASLIAGGAKFDGKQSITVPATASLRLLANQGLTASAWVRIEQPQQATVLASPIRASPSNSISTARSPSCARLWAALPRPSRRPPICR